MGAKTKRISVDKVRTISALLFILCTIVLLCFDKGEVAFFFAFGGLVLNVLIAGVVRYIYKSF